MNFAPQEIVRKMLRKESVFNHLVTTYEIDANLKYSFAVLKIYTENEELKNMYQDVITSHNKKIATSKYPDSGFDLYAPADLFIDKVNEPVFLDFQIKTEMIYYNDCHSEPQTTGYYMYPRSSFSKTPLVLGNHVGIIDSGYRGNLMGAFKFFPNTNNAHNYTIKKDQRLLQVCHPSLCPIFVMLVHNDSFEVTEREAGGFGSTGV